MGGGGATVSHSQPIAAVVRSGPVRLTCILLGLSFCVIVSLSSLSTKRSDTAWGETVMLQHSPVLTVSHVTWFCVCVRVLHARTVSLTNQ